jgi:hypothetical protein
MKTKPTKNTVSFKDAVSAIGLADKHVSKGHMQVSAHLALADARGALAEGLYGYALTQALNSISYSVGVLHPDYAYVKSLGGLE